MALVRTIEERAEEVAHLLDDIVRVPGTTLRFGADPLLGLVPVIGDVLATILGTGILLVARQLNVPWRVVVYMAFNQFKNGLIGSVPFLGDAYSFYFKSNAVNMALLLRTVKRGEEGACALMATRPKILDVAGVAALALPTIALAWFVSLWFWNHNISYLSLLFPRP